MSLLLLNNKYKFSTVGTNYFINVKKYLLINKHTVEEYYRNKIDRVNNNILKDIINDLYRDEADIVDFIFAISSRKDYVLRNYGIVSTGTRGKALKNIFFKNSIEVIMDKDDGLHIDKLDDMIKDWEDIQALTCIEHNYRDTHYHTLNNKLEYLKDKNNISIFTIDFIKLMIQFRCYRINALKLDRAVSASEFLYRYVLPNASESLMNISLINYYITENIDDVELNEVKQTFKTPIVLLNNKSTFDSYMLNISGLFRKMSKNKPYQLLLHRMLLLNGSTLDFLYDRTKGTEYDITNRWANNLSVLKTLYFIIKFMGDGGVRFNRDFIANLRVNLKRFERDKGHIPPLVLDYYTEYILKIKEIIGE